MVALERIEVRVLQNDEMRRQIQPNGAIVSKAMLQKIGAV